MAAAHVLPAARAPMSARPRRALLARRAPASAARPGDGQLLMRPIIAVPSSRRVAAAASSPRAENDVAPLDVGTVIEELPIFPLGVVAFPGADTPLHIFEAR